ncbi:hypothetical protein VTJ83DRAFT_3672 [Remersonia thermophila]|uniref:Invertebrate defensins family profile domain-containing protein n=1 Tax=Remersonia thermophila TaxID=72144 RepID=A0ABR4DES4_9PEZI
MQAKFLLALFGSFAIASAAATPNVDAEVTDVVILETSGPVGLPAVEARDVEVRAADITWQASGGCKTDWANRCNAMCRGEASKKGYKCLQIKSKIWRQSCVFGWSVCDCTCVR